MQTEITERCSYCDKENTVMWDTETDGFAAHCSYCGKLMMLCDECQHTVCEDGEPHDCDWSDETNSCHRLTANIKNKGVN